MYRVSKFLQNILIGINLLVGLLFLVVAYSPYIPPTEHAVYACIGLVFPIVLIAVLCFFGIWLVIRPRLLWLPALFLLLGWKSTTTYYAIGSQEDPQARTIKVLTFNTQMKIFSLGIDHPEKNDLLNYLKDSDADIICLQEFSPPTEKAAKKVNQYLSNYPYHHHLRIGGGNGVGCYSRYPILSAEQIDYPTRFANGSVAYRLLADTDTLLLINNHLETNQINDHDKELYTNMLEGSKQGVRTNSKHLLKKLAQAAYVRGPQADSVAKAIERYGMRYTIVCGDFNDSPISYAHRTIGKGLNDAFAHAGWGLGITYNQAYMYFRIDHILASPAFRIVQCEVDRSISHSDHYPMWCMLERPHKEEAE